MHRRNLMIAGMAAAATFPLTTRSLFAQTATMDEAKMPALLAGNYATETSRLAREQATNQTVRIFADLEIAEQAATAQAFGAEPGTGGLREDHAALLAQLQQMQGAEFDRMYIEGQITGHEELLTIHRTYAAQGTDPMARGASMVGVPSIETHLAMLRGIQNQLG
ncbi:DUF4142 domain-containing protein [Paracoccus sp. (in: a-proteobacteria)]|uniref:DUF4142 domain-containing protein n=1 Tax=Paracoccus sp. TaxID=267 RepID=UPI00396CBDCC